MADIWHSEGLMLTSRWLGWSLMLMVAGVVGLAGCSSGAGPSTTSTPPSSPPAASGNQPVTATDVATGLRKIEHTAQEIAKVAGTDKARAVSLADEIEPAWKPIEDVVKKNDQNIYLTMEDNFAVLEKAADDGDAAAAAKGANAVSSAVQAYLAKYSG
jgi:hypothetical protein